MKRMIWKIILLCLVTTWQTVAAQAQSQCKGEVWRTNCPLHCCCILRLGLNSSVHVTDCSSRQLLTSPIPPTYTEEFILTNNLIKDLGDKLVLLETVRVLDLSENRIKTLRRGPLFRNCGAVEELNLAKNELSTLFRYSLDGLTRLVDLNLSGNKINYFEDDCFSDLENLRHLDLELNTIGSLYPEWFNGLNHLEILNLAHNRIHHIGKQALKSLENLKVLYLNGNRISTIDPEGLSGLKYLEELYLDGNLLLQVPNAALEVLPSLNTLYLDQNPISKLTSFSFCELNLSFIGLNHMPELSIIDALAFYNLPNLSILEIRKNPKLTFFDRDGIRNVPNLRRLDLSDNKLLGISRSVFDSLANTTRLLLGGNPFICDCNARWLRQQFEQQPRIDGVNQLICSDPVSLRGVAMKDLQLNKIEKECKPYAIDFMLNKTITRKIGDTLTLECRALGIPPPVLHWILPDGSIINSSSNFVRIRLKNPGTLIFTHLKASDSGSYTCLAENAFGFSNVSVSLDVNRIDILLFSTLVSSTYVTLVWNGTARNIFPSYQLVYRPRFLSGNATSVSVSSIRKSFTVNGLQPSTDYEFCLNFEESKQGVFIVLSCTQARTLGGTETVGIYKPSFAPVVRILGVIFVLVMATFLSAFITRKYRQRLYKNPDKRSISLDNFSRPLIPGGS
ncbi:leucine-rich repeat neuronal protein 1-like [Artemia franciscana]|uniref:leucine-rich repeat neuronal protein 1-like n=1 Tax=Artemia franciscana TaxID=6661 RepID=UPI0032DB0863